MHPSHTQEEINRCMFSRTLRELVTAGFALHDKTAHARTRYLNEPGARTVPETGAERESVTEAILFLKELYAREGLPPPPEDSIPVLSGLRSSTAYHGAADAFVRCMIRYPAVDPCTTERARTALWVHEASHLAVARYRITARYLNHPRFHHLTLPEPSVSHHGWILYDARRGLSRGRLFEEYVACANEEEYLRKIGSPPQTTIRPMAIVPPQPLAQRLRAVQLEIFEPLLIQLHGGDISRILADPDRHTDELQSFERIAYPDHPNRPHSNAYCQLVPALDELAIEVYPECSPSEASQQLRRILRTAHATGDLRPALAQLRATFGAEGVRFLMSLGSVRPSQLFCNTFTMNLLRLFVLAGNSQAHDGTPIRARICQLAAEWEEIQRFERRSPRTPEQVERAVQEMCDGLRRGWSYHAVSVFVEAGLSHTDLTNEDRERLLEAIGEDSMNQAPLIANLLVHHGVFPPQCMKREEPNRTVR